MKQRYYGRIGVSWMQRTKGWRQWVRLIGMICLLIILTGCQAAPSQDAAQAPSPSLTGGEVATPGAPAPSPGLTGPKVAAPGTPAPSQEAAQAPSTGTTGGEVSAPVKPAPVGQATPGSDTFNVTVNRGQNYSTRDEVAAYIHQYHVLPPNYLTKQEAQKLGWDNSKGNLWQVTDHKSIGGDFFGNREGLLPKASGRQYFECDIDYYGGYRGAKRIVYSNDGLIFYTDDHYASFSKLY